MQKEKEVCILTCVLMSLLIAWGLGSISPKARFFPWSHELRSFLCTEGAFLCVEGWGRFFVCVGCCSRGLLYSSVLTLSLQGLRS
jgi:hypothetical protein